MEPLWERAAHRDRVLAKRRRWGLSRGCHGSIPKFGSVYWGAMAPWEQYKGILGGWMWGLTYPLYSVSMLQGEGRRGCKNGPIIDCCCCVNVWSLITPVCNSEQAMIPPPRLLELPRKPPSLDLLYTPGRALHWDQHSCERGHLGMFWGLSQCGA